MSMVRALLLLPLLAACAPALSPEARCFAEATTAYRDAWRAAQRYQGDLARGYALHRQTVPVAAAAICTDQGAPADCLVNEPRRIDVPVAIDAKDTAARLARARRQMDALRPAAMQAAAPCGYGDWSEAYLAAVEAKS